MADEIFDPEIHATDKDGNPSLNKDGSFRKKRKDAGRKATPSAAPGASSRPSGGGGPARERYRRNVEQFAGIGVTVLSMRDPVMGYAAGELAPMLAAGLADLAVEQPQLAAALEKCGNLGAGATLLSVVALGAVQFGHLMGKVPPHMVKMMGGRTREEIEQILEQRGVELAKQAQQQADRDAAAEVSHHLVEQHLAAEGAREHAA